MHYSNIVTLSVLDSVSMNAPLSVMRNGVFTLTYTKSDIRNEMVWKELWGKWSISALTAQ